MKRTNRLGKEQLKSLWKAGAGVGSGGVGDKKRTMRVFNKANSGAQGKIMIDSDTWVECDWSQSSREGEYHKVHHKSHRKVDRDRFDIGKFPVLCGVLSEIPEEVVGIKEGDMWILVDVEEFCLRGKDDWRIS